MQEVPTLEEMQAARQAFAAPSPEELQQARNEFKKRYGQLGPQRNIPGVYDNSGPVPSVNQGYFKEGAVGSGMFQAGLDIGGVIARIPGVSGVLGATGDDFQHAAQDVDAARQEAGEGRVEGFVRGATRSLMPMALGSKVKVPGLPAATAPIAFGSAIQGSQSLTEARDQGLPEGEALAFAGKAAAVEAASELLFARFLPTAERVISGGVKPSIGNLRGFAGEIAKTAVSEYGQEAATEYLHSANEWLSKINPEEHEWTPEGFITLAKRMNQAGMQGAFLGGGLGAANAGISVAERSNRFVDVTAERAARQEERAGRLAQLKELRDAKPFVSAEDGQKYGVPGDTRKARSAELASQITQAEQEIQNAVQAPEVQQPEVPQEIQAQAPEAAEVPQVRVEPPQPSQEEPPVKPGFVRVYHSGGGGEGPRWVSTSKEYGSNYRPDLPLHYMDLPADDPRVNNPDYSEQGVKQGFTFNFELNPKEASQLTQILRPAPAEAPPPDNRQLLDDAAEFEAAAPEQPKRDVSAEIRDALAQGKVTVSTPKVPGGFPIKRIREDGKVLGRSGDWIKPDETWVINPPKPVPPPVAEQQAVVPPPAEVPAPTQPEPVPPQEVVQPPAPEPLPVPKPPKKMGLKEQAVAEPVTPIAPVEPENEPYKPPYSSDEVRRAQKTAEAARKRFGKRSGPMVPPPIRAEISGKISEQEGRVDDMKEANRKYNEEYRIRAEQAASPPTKPAVEKPVEPVVEKGFALARGKKIEPPAPNPELEKAGIKLKVTPKGWSVTGISQEIADGLSIDYQGKRTGKGHFFRKDPAAALADAARKITEEADVDAAERAAGRVKTSAGYMEAEQAEAFTAELEDRLKLKRDAIAERQNAEEQLVGQFIPKKNRGQFKLKLLRAKETGDADTMKSFDLMVEYSKDHPELGLPQDETDLFNLLARTKEEGAIDESALTDEVVSELLAEADDFNFGANAVEETQDKPAQTIIPGTEEAVADRQRRDEIKESNKQFKTVKAKQTAFISGMDKDLPGQGTMFNVDGAGGTDTAADANPLRSKLQQAADKAVQEAKDELDSFGKMLGDKGLFSNPILDPEVIAGASRVVGKWAKAGVLKFRVLIEQLTEKFGKARVDRLESALASEWDKAYASGEYPGMEQRTPENQVEPQPMSGDNLTSIKKEVVNDMRALVGLPEMEGSTAQTVEEWAERARITLASDPRAAIRLVNELANSSRAINQNETMLLQFRYRQLANELAPVVDEYFEAVKSKDPVAIATAKSAVADARKAMTDFEETIHPSKETWGRTGVALQQMLRKDFSIEAVLRRGQEANDGEELTPDQTAELTALAKKFQDLQSQFEAQRKKTEELEAELASKRQHEEAVTTVKNEKVHRKSDKRAAAEKKVSDAWEKFRQAAASTAGSSGANLIGPAVDVAKAYVELGYVRFSEFMAAVRKNAPDADKKLFREAWDQATAGQETEKLDPTDREELSKAAREIQRELVESGMTDRDAVIDAVHEALQEEVPELTRRQAMDALSRYGIFQRQSQDEIEKLIRGMNSEILKLSQIDQMEIAMKRVDELRAEGKSDEEIGKALDKEKLLVEATGLVRDRPGQTVRQLTQKYNELKKAIPATPSNKAGMLQTTLNQMERALKNRISDLKYEIARREKVVKEKRERPTSDTVKALQAERDALVAIHKEMFPPKKPSEAQRIASAIRGSDKAIAALEKQIANQDFDVEGKPKLSSPELDARRARLEQLRAHRKALKAMEVERLEGEGGKPTGRVPLSDEQIARRAYESSLRTRIAYYTELLAKGDFSPQPKKPPRTLSESELKLRREMEDVRHEVLQRYADYHLANLKGIAWGADKLAEAAHLSRAIMTSFDLSALLRQGGLAALGHPEMAKNALVETVASIARTFDSANAKALQGGVNLENAKKFLATIDSRQAEFDVMHKLTEGPAGELRSKAGLNLPSSDQAITRQEEAFQGRWGKHVPGIALSSRLYTMILNKMRADLFDSMVQNLGRDGQVTMDEAKLIASFVNVATGRSDLKMFNRAAATLNTVFFAPRYVASRFQYLAMPFYLPFKGGLKQNWRVKRAIYKEFGRTAAGIATVLGAFALLGRLLYDDDDEERPQVEADPRSSDFLKVKIGETRLDFMAGLSQVFVLSSRLALGQTKSSVTGKVRNFGEGFEPPTRMSVLAQFARTKFAPVPGAIATIADDWTNVVGRKETPLSMAGSIVTPLSLGDVSTVMQEQGIAKGTAMSILSTLGVGMNTYGPRTEFVTGTPEQRQAQIEKDLKNMQWDSPEQPAYSEFLTSEQLEQFRLRRQEKRGLVVYNATYSGKDEDEIKTRDKNRERLDEMGVSRDEALQLLQDYYKIKEGGLRVHGGTGLKPGYRAKLGALGSIYEK